MLFRHAEMFNHVFGEDAFTVLPSSPGIVLRRFCIVAFVLNAGH